MHVVKQSKKGHDFDITVSTCYKHHLNRSQWHFFLASSRVPAIQIAKLKTVTCCARGPRTAISYVDRPWQIHHTKSATRTDLLLIYFILRYHTEYFYMFRSTRYHHQGIKLIQHKMKLVTPVYSWRGRKGSNGKNLDSPLCSCYINVLDLDVLEMNVTNSKIIKIKTWTLKNVNLRRYIKMKRGTIITWRLKNHWIHSRYFSNFLIPVAGRSKA
jgi:hypothetical protein